jgi:hypothetical protein
LTSSFLRRFCSLRQDHFGSEWCKWDAYEFVGQAINYLTVSGNSLVLIVTFGELKIELQTNRIVKIATNARQTHLDLSIIVLS